ncbi:M48 family metalloprotease [Duganella sp. sic0402]|uniref:M48 family metalloprotease n=1 Tax=Duganella sp. sic0402 TaxID=2854786 RepID=UPI001C47A287|nr:M48 family metalloprotease [Duganella sp. sic0402]MBV7536223.1 M48 family metalloprotease [Duganella sp. sic0402]
MLNKPILSRTGLNSHQIKALQVALDQKRRGEVIDVPAGKSYGAELEVLVKMGEDMTKRFTRDFQAESWPVHFVLLDSKISNAYAYWMASFEVICMTTTLAREIDELCDDVARYLVNHAGNVSGFSYLRDIELTIEVKSASLKGLLVQGVMAFFVGHEAGHLLAGHKPVVLAAAAGAGGDLQGEKDPEFEFFVDDFIAEVASKNEGAGVHSLRLNAHEIDADVQGFSLTARFWLELQEVTQSGVKWPAEAALLPAVSSKPDRLLLLASTGAAIAMSLMGFKQFKGDWNKQETHPLTAVRCVVGLAVLANRLADRPQERLTLQLQGECIEALSLVHSRLASILLMAAKADGEYSQVAQMLKDKPEDQQLGVMFHATGVAQAVALSNDVVKFLAELLREFKACAPERAKAIRVPQEMLVEWSAVVSTP